MARQLSLAVQLPDGETFDSFVMGENRQLLQHLRGLLQSTRVSHAHQLTFFSGKPGTGKSHLLYALCQEAKQANFSHFYLSLKDLDQMHTDVLLGLESTQLVCIDDVHEIQGSQTWQSALFDLINRVRETGICRLVFCANAGPKRLQLSLPDLQSRLTGGLTFVVTGLNDEQRLKALMMRAERRGLQLSLEVGRFMLTHLKRDMPALMSALNELDSASLETQKRLTIPFVKQVLLL